MECSFSQFYLTAFKKKENRYGKRYGLEFKFRCSKERLEERIQISLLSKEVGASKNVIRRRAKAYQELGRSGIKELDCFGREET